MSKEQRFTLKDKLRRLHQLFIEGIREKDQIRKRKLLYYFREKELPGLSQQMETLIIEMKEFYFLKQQIDEIQEDDTSASRKLLSCIDELAFFSNHPNLMPKQSVKHPEEKRFNLDLTESKGLAKMSLKNVMDMAARLKMTVPHEAMANFRLTNPQISIDPSSSVLHNPFNLSNRVKQPEVVPKLGDMIVKNAQISVWSREPDTFIRYTVDETIPSFSHGFIYQPLEKPKIMSSFVFKCVACKAGMLDSPLVSIAYELKHNEVTASSAQSTLEIRAHQRQEGLVRRPSAPTGRSSKIDLGLQLGTPSIGEGTPYETPGYNSVRTPGTPGLSSLYEPPLSRAASSVHRYSKRLSKVESDGQDDINI